MTVDNNVVYVSVVFCSTVKYDSSGKFKVTSGGKQDQQSEKRATSYKQ